MYVLPSYSTEKSLIISYENGELCRDDIHDSVPNLLLFHLDRGIGAPDYIKVAFSYKGEITTYESINRVLVGRGRSYVCSIKEEVKGRYIMKNNKMHDFEYV
jgi:hypothetical protein